MFSKDLRPLSAFPLPPNPFHHAHPISLSKRFTCTSSSWQISANRLVKGRRAAFALELAGREPASRGAFASAAGSLTLLKGRGQLKTPDLHYLGLSSCCGPHFSVALPVTWLPLLAALPNSHSSPCACYVCISVLLPLFACPSCPPVTPHLCPAPAPPALPLFSPAHPTPHAVSHLGRAASG
jgi:hypothetical protein